MRKLMLLSLLVAAVIIPLAYVTPADAQATRTWVSGVGDDANPCSRTAPCKTFAGAISKTANSGEIDCLDSGGFGAVTITKSITIKCEGVIGGVLVSGTNGIIIAATPTDIVTLSGLDMEGLGTGISAIRFTSGAALHVHKVQIRNFRNGGSGISFLPTGNSELYVADSYITDNGNSTTTGGILIAPTGTGTANASINRTQLENNSAGVRVDGAGTSGGSNVTVRDSLVAGSTNNGITATTTAGGVTMMVDNTAVLFNTGVGINANGSGATVRIGNSTVQHNVTGVSQTSSGSLRTYKNNQINGNLGDGTPIANQDLFN